MRPATSCTAQAGVNGRPAHSGLPAAVAAKEAASGFEAPYDAPPEFARMESDAMATDALINEIQKDVADTELQELLYSEVKKYSTDPIEFIMKGGFTMRGDRVVKKGNARKGKRKGGKRKAKGRGGER